MPKRDRTEDIEVAVERYMDDEGLDSLLSIIINICQAKAHFIRTNWQELPGPAQTWQQTGEAIEAVAKSTQVEAVSMPYNIRGAARNATGPNMNA